MSVSVIRLTPTMTAKQVNKIIDDAERKLSDYQLTPKGQILDACYVYSRSSLTSFVRKDPSRYTIVSNLLTGAEILDDLHYYCYAVEQLAGIPKSENSTLKKSVLPIARANLDVLLAPSVASTQKAFIGLLSLGIAMLFTGYHLQAIAMIVAGFVGYAASELITGYRMSRSLKLQLNRILTGGAVKSTIKDGLQDEVARFERTASGMLHTALSMFEKFGK